MGSPTSNIRGICEVEGIQGRGEVVRAVVATGGCVTIYDSHVKRYFGGRMGEAATGIWQLWWGRGRRVGVCL